MNLKLPEKDDDTSQGQALSDIMERECSCSLQEQDLKMVTLASKRRAEEAQLSAATNSKKKRCDDAAIQDECKKGVILLPKI